MGFHTMGIKTLTVPTLLSLALAAILASPALCSEVFSQLAVNNTQPTTDSAAAGTVQAQLTPAQTGYSNSSGSDYASGLAIASLQGQAVVRLQASTYANVTSPGVNAGFDDSTAMNSQVFIYDTLAVSNAPQNGSFVFTYHLDGSASDTLTGNAGTAFGGAIWSNQTYLEALSNPGTPYIDPYTGETQEGTDILDPQSTGTYSLSNNYTLAVPYTNGTGSYQLGLVSDTQCLLAAFYVQGSCSQNLNFGSTLEITGLEVLDANGNPVPNAVVTSASGLNYLALAPVPEPASLGLAIVAIAFAAVCALRKKRNRTENSPDPLSLT